jgi:hypothetical protein
VRSYCDEFECTSSPAVEQTVRALARDLTRLRTWTLSLFAKDVRYQVHSFFGLWGPSTLERLTVQLTWAESVIYSRCLQPLLRLQWV